MELKKDPKETPEQFAARQERQAADDEKFANRDPNIPVILHERFEDLEQRFAARLDAIEGRVAALEPKEKS
jgi:hypothetical protein